MISKYFFQTLALFLTFNLSLCASTFHAVTVADTAGEGLYELIQKDLSHMRKFFGDVFASLQKTDTLSETAIVRNGVDASILNKIDNLEVEPDDIIFFYYTGHGFNIKPRQDLPLPFLYLTNDNLGIDTYMILDKLKDKNARLTICLFDCCNNILKPGNYPNFLELEKGKEPRKMNPVNVSILFENYSGLILMASASPQFYAEGTDQGGSYFTNRFIRFFNIKSSFTNETTWEEILEASKQSLWKSQRPYYDVNLVRI